MDYKESVKNVCGMYNGICRIVCCINHEKGQTGVCCICNCTDQFIACPSYHGGIRDSYGGAAAVGYSSWGEKTLGLPIYVSLLRICAKMQDMEL